MLTLLCLTCMMTLWAQTAGSSCVSILASFATTSGHLGHAHAVLCLGSPTCWFAWRQSRGRLEVAADIQELMPYGIECWAVHQYLHTALLGMGLHPTMVWDWIHEAAVLDRLAARLRFASSKQSSAVTWPP